MPKPIPSTLPPSWQDRLLAFLQRRGWRGFLTAQRLLKPRTGHGFLEVISHYGSQFRLNVGDEIDRHVITEGFYESEVIDAVRSLLGPECVLWVVGANFGLHAVTAKVLSPQTTVVAFEPSPAMTARLIEHCELNKVQIDLHCYALLDREAVLPFHANTRGNPGMSTFHPISSDAYHHTLAVTTLTAAAVIERRLAPAPSVIIIDAEGAEAEVIRGFGTHLQAPSLKMIIFEASNTFLEDHQPRDLHQRITDGFKLTRLERKERTEHALSNFVATRS